MLLLTRPSILLINHSISASMLLCSTHKLSRRENSKCRDLNSIKSRTVYTYMSTEQRYTHDAYLHTFAHAEQIDGPTDVLCFQFLNLRNEQCDCLRRNLESRSVIFGVFRLSITATFRRLLLWARNSDTRPKNVFFICRSLSSFELCPKIKKKHKESI